jgi:hypothetical protein
MVFHSWCLRCFKSVVGLGAVVILESSGRSAVADDRGDAMTLIVPGRPTQTGTVDQTRAGHVAGSRARRNRRVFAYTAGEFHRLNGRRWVERRFDGPDSHFIETARTPEFVELYDRDRDLLVRLRSDHGEWLKRETGEWVPWPGSEGQWK